jgi:hypothetical protein
VDDVVEGQAQMGGVLEGDVLTLTLTHIQTGVEPTTGYFRMGFVPRNPATGMLVPWVEISDAIKAGLEKWGQTRLRFQRGPPQ